MIINFFHNLSFSENLILLYLVFLLLQYNRKNKELDLINDLLKRNEPINLKNQLSKKEHNLIDNNQFFFNDCLNHSF